MVGRGREKRRQGCDEVGVNRAEKKRNLLVSCEGGQGGAEEEKKKKKQQKGIERGPRRRYPSRTAG